MNGRRFFAAALSAALCLVCGAQEFKYDVDFTYRFDNREFDAGGNRYTESGTIHAARLTPSVGLEFRQDRRTLHGLWAGVDVCKEMGESRTAVSSPDVENLGLLREVTLWYTLDARLPHTRWQGWAGIFPQKHSAFGTLLDDGRFSGRHIPTAFVSDAVRFYDANLEGFLVKATRRRAVYETGLDWNGKIGPSRREQFRIFSYGKGALDRAERLYAGWAGQVHHYANSYEVSGVVDDILLAPFLEADLRPRASSWRRMDVTLSWLQSFQRDRKRESGMQAGGGLSLTLDAGYKAVGLRNDTFLGDDLMPLYGCLSPEGTPYAADLYRGSPFYAAKGEPLLSDAYLYNRLEAWWQPRIADFLDLRISAVFHFDGAGFQGWQQQMTLVFNLGRTRARRQPDRSVQERMRAPSFFDLIL